MVVHTCNLRHSGGGDWEDLNSRPVPAKKREKKKLATPHLNKLARQGGNACNPSYTGDIVMRITGLQTLETYLNNN
jgi:hypothetical protein